MDFTKSYQFNFPTVIRFGVGVIRELSTHLKEVKKVRPLIVTDPGLAQLDMFKSIVGELTSSGITPLVFSSIDKNPVKENVISGVDVFCKEGADSIIGLGGGASMDVARAIALGAYHKRDLFDFDDALGGDKFVTEEIPYFITVPTTSGTGSEVGRSSVISEDESHRKRILFSPRLMAKIVFADPQLTINLPPKITAATGMDALTHNIEAFVAKGFHPLCDGIAIEGVRLVAEGLEGAVFDPQSIENRAKMMMAALMGATAFQKGLGVVHSLAHPLSTLFDTHHGLANAIMLPYGIDFNLKVCDKKFEFLGRLIGVGDFRQWVMELNEKIHMPKSLKEIDIPKERIDELSDLAYRDVCHQSNPRPCIVDDFKDLYSRAIL